MKLGNCKKLCLRNEFHIFHDDFEDNSNAHHQLYFGLVDKLYVLAILSFQMINYWSVNHENLS